MFSILLITLGFVESGKLKFVLFQDTDSEIVIVNLDMGPGTQAHETMDVIRFIQSEAEKFEEVEGVISFVGSRYSDDGTRNENTTEGIGQLVLDLRGAEYRDSRGLRKSQDLIDDLRIQVGPIPGAKSLKYEAAQGGPPGGDIELELRAPDYEMLSAATDEIIDRMAGYSGVTDIEDSLELGKSEVRIKLLPAAEALNLTTRDLAWQIRGAFFGDEAQSLQRDREEVKVYTRLKPEARDDLAALENFRVKLPSGERVPFSEVATFEMGRGYSRLTRIDGQRAVRITAQVMESKGNITEITNDLEAYLAEASRTKYSGLNYTFAGEKKKVTDAFSSLKVGVPAALLGIYALLAIIFHSYLQPLIIMAAIPFGIVGAIWGHPIMGYPLTMLSVIGIAALSGIVVNDSLILVDFVNEQVRRGNHNLIDAVVRGGRLRLRAIILTTLTTVFGLAPLMLERSFQAQFLIPMAVSISFGLAFATIITLLLVPSLYLVLEDIRRVFIWIVFNKTGDIDPIGMRAIRTEEAIRKGYEQSEENAPAPIS
jgi:multidrug efflux pump subunit AcrB